MKQAILFFLTVGLAGSALASQQTGRVTEIRVTSKTLDFGNPTHITLSGPRTAVAACAFSQWWAIDTDTPGGRSMLAAVLAAQANGKEVTFLGRDRCNLRGDMETVEQVHLVP